MSKLDELKKQITQQLDLCDPQDTPTVCALKDTSEGLEKVVDQVVQKVLYGNSISIADAIVEIDNEYSLNATE